MREWVKLKVKVFVPCTCGTHRYTLESLEEGAQANKKIVVCPQVPRSLLCTGACVNQTLTLQTRAQIRLDLLVPEITMASLTKIEFDELTNMVRASA